MQRDLDCLSEDEALRLAQRGNAFAFEFLYRRHRGRVYALCLRMVKDPAQAEDLTQETFLAVLRGIQMFRGESAFATWLHQVTRNTVLMSIRKKKLQETSLEEIVQPNSERGRFPKELGTPDRRLEHMADHMTLQSAISKLSHGFRRALVLHDLHGYEHREIAAILGWATGTSKSQLHKARLRVRELLKKCFENYGRKERRPDTVSRAPLDGKSGSNGEKDSIAHGISREREKPIPSWCEPLDEEST